MAEAEDLKTLTGWNKGSNNLADVDGLPAGYVRETLNVDATESGHLKLRPGYERVAPLVAARAAIPYGDNLVIADGAQLLLFNSRTASLSTLGTIAPAGGVCGAELAGELFVCTANERLRLRDDQLLPWGLDQPQGSPTIGSGRLAAGAYRVAMAAVTADGVESGAVPYVLQLAEGSAVTITPTLPAGAVAARLYATEANGDTLYLQDERAAGAFVLSDIRSDTARLTTENLTPPPMCEQMATHNGRLLLAAGAVLHYTEAFMPHHHHRLRGHISFPRPIDVVVSLGGLVYVVADKTYAVSGLGTAEQSVRTVLNCGGVRGTGVLLPDGRAAWMTKYGQAFGGQDGTVELPTRTSYAPPVAEHGSAGVMEADGRQTIVTNLRGQVDHNGLGLRDDYDLEIT